MKNEIFMRKIAFYSCLIDDYDYLFEPNKDLRKFFNFYLFTNNTKLQSKSWNIIRVKKKINSFYTNRYFKILLHDKILKYEYSIYFDSNIFLKWNILYLLNKFINSGRSIGLLKHSSRISVDQELNQNLLKKKISNKSYLFIKNFYKKRKYFSKNDLTENGIIFRKHDDKNLLPLMNLWWKITTFFFIRRDQITLPYSLWKKKVIPKIFNINIWNDTRYFFILPHKKKVFYHKIYIFMLFYLKKLV